jgi:hypothetical protein
MAVGTLESGWENVAAQHDRGAAPIHPPRSMVVMLEACCGVDADVL